MTEFAGNTSEDTIGNTTDTEQLKELDLGNKSLEDLMKMIK